MEFAILDVETTGGYGTENRITEIAIIIHDGQREIERYSTLVNPESFIPQRITELTGITNQMVRTAPKFQKVARKVWDLTNNRIFVAHNVSFDYGVIRNEFGLLGTDFTRRKLCTVRLSRKVLPGKESYSLGKLCYSLGISLDNAHRALADTEVTVRLFEILLSEGSDSIIKNELRALNKESKIPPKLEEEVFDKLPNICGVYRFYNEDGETIFIGSSKEIKTQITKHFKSVDGKSKESEMVMEVANVSFEITASELIGELKSESEIVKLKPQFNKPSKTTNYNIGITQYTDQNGYQRLIIDKKVKQSTSFFMKFSRQAEAKLFLQDFVRKGRLCDKLVGLDNSEEQCAQHDLSMCKGACVKEELPDVYNTRFEDTLENMAFNGDSFFVKDIGRSIDEFSVAWIQNGEYQGCGFLNHDISDVEEIKKSIPVEVNKLEVLKTIKSYIVNSKLELIPLRPSSIEGNVGEVLTLF
jgi:DNA polymerase-3 subunit epsilon